MTNIFLLSSIERNDRCGEVDGSEEVSRSLFESTEEFSMRWRGVEVGAHGVGRRKLKRRSLPSPVSLPSGSERPTASAGVKRGLAR
jgi:hypothetical protein